MRGAEIVANLFAIPDRHGPFTFRTCCGRPRPRIGLPRRQAGRNQGPFFLECRARIPFTAARDADEAAELGITFGGVAAARARADSLTALAIRVHRSRLYHGQSNTL